MVLSMVTTLAFASASRAQQLSGISIGDNIKATDSLGFAPSQVNRNGPFVISKWSMPDGNDLSVTATADGTIVFMENDWNGGVSGRFTDFPGLVFGKTTLNDIRKLTGSNGYCYVGTGCVQSGNNSLVSFNSFAFSHDKNIVITFITVLAANSKPDPGKGQLRAIILAYDPYLRGIWGEKTIADPKYRSIN